MTKGAKQSLTPKLRFPEFRNDKAWTVDPLADVAYFVNQKTPLSNVLASDYVSTENLLPDYGGMTPASRLPPTGSVTQYRAGDVLISNIRPYLKKVWHADRDGGASNDVIVVRAKHALSKSYLSLTLKNDAFIAYVMSGAKGLKMPRGDVDSMREYPVAYPGEREQQKIADCLTPLDELIAAVGRQLDALKAHKKGLMQQLFPREGETRPRLRFPDFRVRQDWKGHRIRDLLEKTSRPVELNEELTYREIGVRSHGKGVFHKNAASGASIGTKRVFWVVEDAFVLNIIFAWEQAIAFTTKAEAGMIASHRFPMFLPKSNACDVRFLKFAFLTPTGKHLLGLASPGGAGRNRTLGQDEFDKLEIVVPEKDEQTKIAEVILATDAHIAAASDKLDALKTHKKGLMQQLFPSPEGD